MKCAVKIPFDRRIFGRELIGWAGRGLLCAAVSFCWAMAAGFSQAVEIAGMLFGIAFWVVVFAWNSAWSLLTASSGKPSFGRALKTAAWIKFGLTVFGLLLLASLKSGFVPRGMGLLGFAATLDVWLGLAALWLTGQLGGFVDFEQIARLNSAGWTTLTTTIEGALMAVVIVGIALLIWGCRRINWCSLEMNPASDNPVDGR